MHPLPIPDRRGDSIAIDFIGPCPTDQGFDGIVTITDRLGADIRIAATHMDITAERFAAQFFNLWYCENGLPLNIVSDRDKLFVSAFWRALCKLTGIKLKMSSAYHPETDGSSERSNKTVVQCLRYHVQRNQTGWVRALPRVRFNLMNTVNVSTGFSPFLLRMGRSPRLIPPLAPDDIAATTSNGESAAALALLERINLDVDEAKDNLLAAKVAQATFANRHRGDEVVYSVGDKVMLLYPSANRDEAYFPDPYRFDIGRAPNEQGAFGTGGPHFCLGAHLARREVIVMFGELLRRLPDIRATAAPERLRSNFIHGVKRLPAAFTPRPLA